MYVTIYWDRVAPSSGSNDASDADSEYNTYVIRILASTDESTRMYRKVRVLWKRACKCFIVLHRVRTGRGEKGNKRTHSMVDGGKVNNTELENG